MSALEVGNRLRVSGVRVGNGGMRPIRTIPASEKETPAVGAAGEERKEREEEKGVELSGTGVPDQLFADMFYENSRCCGQPDVFLKVFCQYRVEIVLMWVQSSEIGSKRLSGPT
ncbi:MULTISPECIES: hypothetical protein [unclassified Bifidobacterium]|uniref:hypothetical protein n=1 Tax=unclassified Bifidobacterium TaxID=2608897 RepID=UPI003F91E43F